MLVGVVTGSSSQVPGIPGPGSGGVGLPVAYSVGGKGEGEQVGTAPWPPITTQGIVLPLEMLAAALLFPGLFHLQGWSLGWVTASDSSPPET